MKTATGHYFSRAKERTNVKNRQTNERVAELALLRGKRAEEYKSKEKKYLSSRESRNCIAFAYNGFCYIFSQEKCCITTYALPEWFGKRVHYSGKEAIRDYRKFCKYNQFFDERPAVS